jgi:hypothetical protein
MFLFLNKKGFSSTSFSTPEVVRLYQKKRENYNHHVAITCHGLIVIYSSFLPLSERFLLNQTKDPLPA